MPPTILRCHFDADSSCPNIRATESHNDWTDCGGLTSEAFWARLQVELLNTRRWATTIALAAAMADYIDNFYNVERRAQLPR
jgi:hypothetical protein